MTTPDLLTITPDMVRQAGYALIGALGAILTAVGVMLRVAHKLGKDAQKVSTALESLVKIETEVKKIALIEIRLGTVEEAWTNTRSDIKHLLRGSRPDMEHDSEE